MAEPQFQFGTLDPAATSDAGGGLQMGTLADSPPAGGMQMGSLADSEQSPEKDGFFSSAVKGLQSAPAAAMQALHGQYLEAEEAGTQGGSLGGDTPANAAKEAAVTQGQLQQDQAGIDAHALHNPSTLGEGAYNFEHSMATAVPNMLGAGAAGLVMGVLAPAAAPYTAATLGTIGGMQGAQQGQEGTSYAQSRTQKPDGTYPVPDSTVAAANASGKGDMEAVWAANPIGKLVAHVGTAGLADLVKEFTWNEWKAAIPNGVSQNIVDQLTTKPDRPFGEQMKEMKDEIISNMAQSVGGPFAAGAAKGLHGVVNQTKNGWNQITQSEARPYLQMGDLDSEGGLQMGQLMGSSPSADTAPLNNIPTLDKSQIQVTSNPPKSAYDNTFAAVSKQLGVPYDLLRAVGYQESTWRPEVANGSVTSKTGAVGVMQVEPQTALNINGGRPVDLTDPTQNIITAAKILKQNYQKFGNWHDAVAAYNGGWNPSKWGNSETQAYLKNVFGTEHSSDAAIPTLTTLADGTQIQPGQLADSQDTGAATQDTETAAPAPTAQTESAVTPAQETSQQSAAQVEKSIHTDPTSTSDIDAILQQIEGYSPTDDEVEKATQMKALLDDPSTDRHTETVPPELSGINTDLASGIDTDSDIGRSLGIQLRRQDENDTNADIPRHNRVVSAGPDDAVGMLLHEAVSQGKFGQGTVLGIGQPNTLFHGQLMRLYQNVAQQWVQKFMPNARVILNFEKTPGDSLGAHFMTNQGIHVITPRDMLGFWDGNTAKGSNRFSAVAQNQAVYSFSHEFGHAMMLENLRQQLSPDQFQLVHESAGDKTLTDGQIASLPDSVRPMVQEYNNLKQQILSGEMTAGEFLQKWMSPWKAGQGVQVRTDSKKSLFDFLTKRGVSPKDSALRAIQVLAGNQNDPTGLKYMLSFPEYSAEQFSRYSHTTGLVEKSPFGQYFAHAMTMLKNFFKYLKAEKIIAPGVKFQEWVDGLSRNRNTTGTAPAGQQVTGERVQLPTAQRSESEEGEVAQPTAGADQGTAEPAPSPEFRAAENPEVRQAFNKAILKSRVKEADPAKYSQWMQMAKFGQYAELNHELEKWSQSFVRINYDRDAKSMLRDLGLQHMDVAGLTEAEAQKPSVVAKAHGLWMQLGVRSPFFKRWFGDWEAYNDSEYAGWAKQMQKAEADGDAARMQRLQDARPRTPIAGMASKIVDAMGRPLVVYHATPYDKGYFHSFDPNRLGETTGAPSAKLGFFAAASPLTSQSYLENETVEHITDLNKWNEHQDHLDRLNGEFEPLEERVKALRSEFRDAWNKEVIPGSGLRDIMHNVDVADLFHKLTTYPDSLDEALYNLDGSGLRRAIKNNPETMQELHGLARQLAETQKTVLDKHNDLENQIGEHERAQQRYVQETHIHKGQIMPLYLNIRNPYVFDMKGETYREKSYHDIIQEAKLLGRDGVIIKNTWDGGPRYNEDGSSRTDTIYVAFDPAQMKSAIGNTTFSDSTAIHWDRSNPEENAQATLFDSVEKLGLGKALNRMWAKGARWSMRGQTYLLQLQQLAHLHPDIEGLQLMDQLRLSYAALKNRLQEFPNRVVNGWRTMPKEARAKMEKFLQGEFDSGKHLTELVQTDGQWEHRISAAAWDRLKELGIDPATPIGERAGQQVLDIKNSLLQHTNALQRILADRIVQRYGANQTVQNVELAKLVQAIKEIRETPFLPQTRFGQYALLGYKAVPGENGRTVRQKVWQEHFDTLEDRDRAYASARAKDKTMSWKVKDLSDYQATIMALPHNFLDQAAEVLDLTPQDRQALAELLDGPKTPRGFRPYDRDFLRVGGASKDLLRNYASHTWHNANLLAKMQYRPQFNRSIAMVRSAQTEIMNDRDMGVKEQLKQRMRHQIIQDAMEKTRDYMMTPPNELQTLRGLVSLTYLYGNLKTAVLQSSIAFNVIADATAKYGMVNGLKHFSTAARDSLRMYKNPKVLTPEEQYAMDTARKEGILDQSYAYHLAGIANAGNLRRLTTDSKVGPIAQKITEMGMVPFKFADHYFRRVGLLADFRARYAQDLHDAQEEGSVSPEHDAATRSYAYAIAKTQQLQNDFSAANRPEFMRGKRSLFMIFFSYMQHMMFLMSGGYELGDRRLQELQTGEKPSAKSWLGGTTARLWLMYLAMAGIQGLPFAENILDIVNFFYRKLFKADVRQDMRHFIKDVGANPNLIMHGLGHNIGGFDLSPSIGLGRVIPGTDVLTSNGSWNDRFASAATEVAGPLGGAVKNTGQFLTSDDPFLKRMGKFGLGAFKNVFQAADWAANGARFPSGALIARGDDGQPRQLTDGELMGKAIGFTPTAISQEQEKHYAVKDMEQFWSTARKSLLDQAWQARVAKDREAVADTKKAIQEYNENTPDHGLKITGHDLAQSFKTHRHSMLNDMRDRSQQKHFRGLDRGIEGNY